MTLAPPSRANRLAAETSPYLLQHAHNPVDWYPWGPEALERARREELPILLSIGYAACHWCHVMERESFEDAAIARLMNEHFVCIKVDREERPDLDDVYMAATVALSGHGGWPMTVFLTPDQRPFFAGTYFPPTARHGRPGLSDLLQRVAELWRADRETLLRQATELTRAVAVQSASPRPGPVGDAAIARAVRELGRAFDAPFGGFSPAPKFPPSSALSLLLRQHARSGDADALRMARVTLDAMKNGGIYDHLGGGFARYSTDDRWLVPHFEKMLYDNAQLARVYLEAYQVTRDAEYARVARETLDYISREMQGEAGGYFSATDADSEGEEGKFFVWRAQEIEAVLGGEAERFSRFYDVTSAGNWEGKCILNTPRALEEVARELGVGRDELTSSLARSREKLYEVRSRRVPPLLDDKVLVSWNALMIGAMAEGFRVLRERAYLESAARAAEFVLSSMIRPDGGLYRTARGDRVHLDAYLEDYAFLADALLDLYEAGGSPQHLEHALALGERLLADFGDAEGGGFFATAQDHEPLIVRPREGHDGALPNANAVAARALARLAAHLGREDLRDHAVRAIRAYGAQIERAPRSHTCALSVADFLLEPPVEVVVSGPPGDAGCEALWAELGRHFLPNRVLGHAHAPAESSALEHPLVEHKGVVAGRPALFVCKDYTCQAPVTEPRDVAAALERARRGAAEERRPELTTVRLTGAATAEQTRAFAARHQRVRPEGYTALGASGLTTSRLGFGGYRVEEGERGHRAALVSALLGGVNLIDTSTNYTGGESERLIGDVLSGLVREGRVAREEIIVVSKVGYAQGENLAIARERKRQGRPFPGMVEYGEEIWHSIHPEWIEDQLTRSLARLGLETLDVCLLHNPEYFLSDAAKRENGPLQAVRDEFYGRLEGAFACLEAQVRAGRLRAYGVSSNTVVSPEGEPDATDLRRMLDAARRAGGASHHFQILQLPFNLLEQGALLERSRGASVLEHAREANLAVLVNRPLNAFPHGALFRLAEPAVSAAPTTDVEDARDTVMKLEQEFRASFVPHLRTPSGARAPDDLLDWGRRLAQVAADVASLEQWQELEQRLVRPQVASVLETLDAVFTGELGQPWGAWRAGYTGALEQLLDALRHRAAERSRARVSVLVAALAPALPDVRRSEPLSRVALWALTSTPGVTCVLVGMRRPAYVSDALGVLSWAPHVEPTRLFAALRSAGIAV